MSEQVVEPVVVLGAATGAVAQAVESVRPGVMHARSTAVQAVTDALAAIAVNEPHVHALLHVDARAALAAARRQDRRLALGHSPGPLAGVPLVVKDNVAVRRMPLTCGSQALPAAPAAHDAVLVRRLRLAGAIVLGKTNLDELGMGASTETSAFGPTRNPRDLTRTAGGSSGGSAAAVATGEVRVAVGTDTGGSIREPAAQCGVVGVKPTHGAVPAVGVVPFAPSLDQAGPLAATVGEAALLHEVMAATTGLRAAATLGADDHDLRGHRVGVVRQMSGSRNAPGVLDRFGCALATLSALGADVVEVDLASVAGALEAYYLLSSAECVPTLRAHADLAALGPEAARRYAVGVAAAEEPGGGRLARARAVVAAARVELATAFVDCTLLASPTLPVVAPLLGGGTDDPMTAPRTDCWTVLANLTGAPALSLPAGDCRDTGLPVGLQLLAPQGADARLYRIAASLEAASAATTTAPPPHRPSAAPQVIIRGTSGEHPRISATPLRA